MLVTSAVLFQSVGLFRGEAGKEPAIVFVTRARPERRRLEGDVRDNVEEAVCWKPELEHG
jgi:hypothetical protein